MLLYLSIALNFALVSTCIVLLNKNKSIINEEDFDTLQEEKNKLEMKIDYIEEINKNLNQEIIDCRDNNIKLEKQNSALITHNKILEKENNEKARFEEINIENENRKKEIENLNEKLKNMNDYEEIKLKNTNYENEIKNLKEKLDNMNDYEKIKKQNDIYEEKLAQINKDMEKNNENMKTIFENIANDIIKKQKTDFTEHQKNALTDFSEKQKNILKPFEDQLNELKTKITETNNLNIENKTSIVEQINALKTNNENLAKEAQDLTKALKGDKKKQGNWGEIQLERLLEKSGLKEGVNYRKQITIKDEEGKRLIPDFIIELPENRTIIVDSKVSLINYTRYFEAEDEKEKEKYLKDYVTDLKNHIKELSNKEYQKQLRNSISLDYVFMFLPMERAYIDAVDSDESLYKLAYDNEIAIATPSSLMPILRAIEHLWNIEKQNKNIDKIMSYATKIYDKIVGFQKDMENINKCLDKAKNSYTEATNKLYSGKGNLCTMAENMKQIGLKSKKQLNIENVEYYEGTIEYDDEEVKYIENQENMEEESDAKEN